VNSLAPLLQEFFTSYLTGQRGASPATIRTYRDTWRLFLDYLVTQTATAAYRLDLSDIDEQCVIAFLDHLEHERGNAVSTRNLRLAGIKAALAFSAHRTPEHLNRIARIQSIPIKRTTRPQIAYLHDDELQALLDAIDTNTWTGRRDMAMFALAAQTGLRISEITSLTLTSLHLTPGAAHVSCEGKGRKQRTTPLTLTIASLMRQYLPERAIRPGTALFPNRSGSTLSPDAVAHRLATHLERARRACPGLQAKHVTVHTLRHTAAMRFLQAGIDTSVIALWLGHESPATTSIYLHADQTLKQRALQRTSQPDATLTQFQSDDPLLAWLEAL